MRCSPPLLGAVSVEDFKSSASSGGLCTRSCGAWVGGGTAHGRRFLGLSSFPRAPVGVGWAKGTA